MLMLLVVFAPDEFDFHVANLAVDLRDGVRLVRLVEVVTNEWGLAAGLRVPAGSRLQASFSTVFIYCRSLSAAAVFFLMARR